MKMQDIKEKAQGMGVAPGKLKKSDLIRAIQTKEGNEACFDTGKSLQCGQSNCLWRGDCK